MAIEDFLKTWKVVKPPEPDGEDTDHQVEIKRNGHSNAVTITCLSGHPVRHGTYSADSNQIVGDGFHLELAPPALPPRIVCLPGNVPNTGSWTAEDTSGQLDG